MKEPIQGLFNTNVPEKVNSGPIVKKRYSANRIWKSAIPSSSSPKRKAKISPKKTPEGRKSKVQIISARHSPRQQMPEKSRLRKPPIRKRKKIEKKKDFLLTSTSFLKKNNVLDSGKVDSSASSTIKKKKRRRKKKVSKKRIPHYLQPLRKSVIHPVPSDVKHIKPNDDFQNHPIMKEHGKYVDAFQAPVDMSLRKSFQKRVDLLKKKIENSNQPDVGESMITPPKLSKYLVDNDEEVVPKQNKNQPISPHRKPSIIGPGDKQYLEEQKRRKELESELNELRQEVLNQKKQKIKVSNELKVMEIRKEKQKLEELKKQKEEQEKKQIKELESLRNTRILLSYFGRWKFAYRKTQDLKNHEKIEKLEKQKQFKLKISVIFRYKLKRRIFRRFRKICSSLRRTRMEKELQEKLRKENLNVKLIQRNRHMKVYTKYFQKWRYKCRMKLAEKELRKEKEQMKKQRSRFMDRFLSEIGSSPKKLEEEMPTYSSPSAPHLKSKKSKRVIISNFGEKEDSGHIGRSQGEENSGFVVVEEMDGDEVEGMNLNPKRIKNIHDIKLQSSTSRGIQNIEISRNSEVISSMSMGSVGGSPSRNTKRRKKKLKKLKNKHGGGKKVPKFLKNLEDRRKKREENWKKLEEKYKTKKVEEEKAAEEEIRRKEDEELQKKKEVKLKKRRLEREKKRKLMEKRKRIEEVKKNTKLAREKRKELLMKYYGWIPLRKYYNFRKEMMEQAELYHKKKMKLKVLWLIRKFKDKVQKERMEEEKKKIQVFERVVELRKKTQALRKWRMRVQNKKEEMLKYDTLYKRTLKKKVFHLWMDRLIQKRKDRVLFLENIEERVVVHGRKVTLRYYFRKLQANMMVKRDEKEKEEIGKELEEKIRGWLTEFRLKTNFNWEEL